jgi:transposase
MSDANEMSSLERERTEKRRYWRKHIAAWRRSGLSQSAYCRENDLSFHQFRYWKKRVHDDKVDESVGLVEIEMESCQIHSKSPVASPMMLFIADRFSVRVEPDFNEDHLTRLIRVLERL